MEVQMITLSVTDKVFQKLKKDGKTSFSSKSKLKKGEKVYVQNRGVVTDHIVAVITEKGKVHSSLNGHMFFYAVEVCKDEIR
jgi:hypothetical protein